MNSKVTFLAEEIYHLNYQKRNRERCFNHPITEKPSNRGKDFIHILMESIRLESQVKISRDREALA